MTTILGALLGSVVLATLWVQWRGEMGQRVGRPERDTWDVEAAIQIARFHHGRRP